MRKTNKKIWEENFENALRQATGNYIDSLDVLITQIESGKYRDKAKKTKTKKNIWEGWLIKAQLTFISNFKVYLRTEGNSVIIEIPFPKDNWTNKKDAEELAEHIRSLRE